MAHAPSRKVKVNTAKQISLLTSVPRIEYFRAMQA
jgi:hypothetical protein